MRAKDADGLSRLHQQSFIIFDFLERTDDCVVSLPTPRGLPRSPIDNQVVGFLSDLAIEIIHQAAQRGFLMPAFAIKLSAAWRNNVSTSSHLTQLSRDLQHE
jgi:hypothetical protein